jgi:hypothetical protein
MCWFACWEVVVENGKKSKIRDVPEAAGRRRGVRAPQGLDPDLTVLVHHPGLMATPNRRAVRTRTFAASRP